MMFFLGLWSLLAVPIERQLLFMVLQVLGVVVNRAPVLSSIVNMYIEESRQPAREKNIEGSYMTPTSTTHQHKTKPNKSLVN